MGMLLEDSLLLTLAVQQQLELLLSVFLNQRLCR